MTLEKEQHTAKAHTTDGRDGASRSSDGRLDIELSPPGTAGSGTNPEQLFAAGWSACFIDAMGLGRQNKGSFVDHKAAAYRRTEANRTRPSPSDSPNSAAHSCAVTRSDPIDRFNTTQRQRKGANHEIL